MSGRGSSRINVPTRRREQQQAMSTKSCLLLTFHPLPLFISLSFLLYSSLQSIILSSGHSDGDDSPATRWSNSKVSASLIFFHLSPGPTRIVCWTGMETFTNGSPRQRESLQVPAARLTATTLGCREGRDCVGGTYIKAISNQYIQILDIQTSSGVQLP